MGKLPCEVKGWIQQLFNLEGCWCPITPERAGIRETPQKHCPCGEWVPASQSCPVPSCHSILSLSVVFPFLLKWLLTNTSWDPVSHVSGTIPFCACGSGFTNSTFPTLQKWFVGRILSSALKCQSCSAHC